MKGFAGMTPSEHSGRSEPAQRRPQQQAALHQQHGVGACRAQKAQPELLVPDREPPPVRDACNQQHHTKGSYNRHGRGAPALHQAQQQHREGHILRKVAVRLRPDAVLTQMARCGPHQLAR